MICVPRKRHSERENKIKILVGNLKGVSKENCHIFNLSRYASDVAAIGVCPFIPLVATSSVQTYRQWKACVDITFTLRRIRNTPRLTIQPLDDFPVHIYAADAPTCLLERLRKHIAAFFPFVYVSLAPAVSTTDWKVARRIHPRTKMSTLRHDCIRNYCKHKLFKIIVDMRLRPQLLVSDLQRGVYSHLRKCGKARGHNFAILAITWTDLYPSQDMNFVLGDTAASLGVAVVCFGRYDPSTGSPCNGKTLLWKMIKVCTHEICHLFYMQHCDGYFHCAMQASTSYADLSGQPNFLCPVCLRKLHRCLKFDVTERYREILSCYQRDVAEVEPSGENACSVELHTCVEWLKHIIKYTTTNHDSDINL